MSMRGPSCNNECQILAYKAGNCFFKKVTICTTIGPIISYVYKYIMSKYVLQTFIVCMLRNFPGQCIVFTWFFGCDFMIKMARNQCTSDSLGFLLCQREIYSQTSDIRNFLVVVQLSTKAKLFTIF